MDEGGLLGDFQNAKFKHANEKKACLERVPWFKIAY